MARECTRCLITDEVPGATVPEDGLCSVCRTHDATWGDGHAASREERRRALEELLRLARSRRARYDVLVPLSGGKDSCYMLYLLRKQHHMRCLAVTFDNGFLSDHARQNIKNATEVLAVDHTYVRFDRAELMQLYRTFFLASGMWCPACMRGIAYAVDETCAAHRIPLIAMGTSARTEEFVSPEFFVANDAGFFLSVMAGRHVPRGIPFRYRGHPMGRFPSHFLPAKTVMRYFYGVRINLPDYCDWDYDEVFATIKRELGWVARTDRAEHADCVVEPLVQYMRHRKFPALRPELLRYSKLASIGAMSKEEARRAVDAGDDGTEPPCLEVLLDSLSLAREEFEAAIADPLRHMPYVEAAGNTLRARLRRALS